MFRNNMMPSTIAIGYPYLYSNSSSSVAGSFYVVAAVDDATPYPAVV
jgi:hypothetical protein